MPRIRLPGDLRRVGEGQTLREDGARWTCRPGQKPSGFALPFKCNTDEYALAVRCECHDRVVVVRSRGGKRLLLVFARRCVRRRGGRHLYPEIVLIREHEHRQRLAVRREGAGQSIWLNQCRLSAAGWDAAQSPLVVFAASEVDRLRVGSPEWWLAIVDLPR